MENKKKTKKGYMGKNTKDRLNNLKKDSQGYMYLKTFKRGRKIIFMGILDFQKLGGDCLVSIPCMFHHSFCFF